MTKNDLADKILRRFGHPLVKVELSTVHLFDAIDYSTKKWQRWASGASNQEVFHTMALSAGQYLYDMPLGTQDVLSYDASGIGTGINTLFTVDNYMFNKGMYDSLIHNYGNGYTLVSYHIAREFLETVKKYTPDSYNFKYHRYTNQLEIQPPPPSGGNLTYTPKYVSNGVEVAGTETTIDSPGFILIRSIMLQGASYDPDFNEADFNKNLYESVQWIEDYATAFCKRTLGLVRRKFNNFTTLGNQGIPLDGPELLSEAEQDMEKLMEALKTEESEWGYSIIIG